MTDCKSADWICVREYPDTNIADQILAGFLLPCSHNGRVIHIVWCNISNRTSGSQMYKLGRLQIHALTKTIAVAKSCLLASAFHNE